MVDSVVKASLASLQTFSKIAVDEVLLLKGLPDQVQEIMRELESMEAYLIDADTKKESNNIVNEWLEQVRDVAYDVQDTIEKYEYRFQRQQSGGFSGFLKSTTYLPKDLWIKHTLCNRLERIQSRIEKISVRRGRYPSELKADGASAGQILQHHHNICVLTDQIVGKMNEKIDSLAKMLVDEKPQQRMVILVTGRGGLGKTTLVMKAFEVVKNRFDCSASISVSRTPDVKILLKSLLNQFYKAKEQNVPSDVESMEVPRLINSINNYLREQRYIVVLDDVWNLDAWNSLVMAFPRSSHGSRIMVTTQNLELSSQLGSGVHNYPLEHLTDKEARELFCLKAFWGKPCPQNLESWTEIFVKKCEGLPLAITSIGSLLASMPDDPSKWEVVYSRFRFELEKNPVLGNLKGVLSLSFSFLPHHLKRPFLYFSIFPEDRLIHRKVLIRLWIAEGFVEEDDDQGLEDTAEEYLMQLIHRSMIQPVETNESGRIRTCRMHDLMHDLALSKSKEENFCLVYRGKYPNSCQKIRRLSFWKNGEGVPSNISVKYLRSFYTFEVNTSFSSSLQSLIPRFKYLRVLHLQDVAIESISNELTDLFNLRYLNLRGTNIQKLPDSFNKLKNLQTLDIRDTKVERIPDGIVKLHKLRHLYLKNRHDRHYNKFNYFSSVQVPHGICYLKELRSLHTVEATEEIVREAVNLSQLRRCGIHKLRANDGQKFCNSVKEMKELRALTIRSTNEDEFIRLETLSPPPLHLEKLGLYGRLENVPDWFCLLENLTHLRLQHSRLGNILSSLQRLHNLVFLTLYKAYDGQLLHFHVGMFPRLKRLNLHSLSQLDKVELDQGALPNIEVIHLIGCSELKMVPEGIEHLKGLQQLYLVEMPRELADRIKEDAVEDHPKVRHISNIRYFYKSEGRTCVERLS